MIMKQDIPKEGQGYWTFSARKTGSHRYLAPRILQACRKYVHGGDRVFDIGCGNGWLARDLTDSGYQVVGLEPSESGVRNARALVPEAVVYELSIYDDLSAIPDGSFDIAVSAEVIEHLYNPQILVDVAWHKLKDGGVFVITTPYHGYLKNLLIALCNKWDSHHKPMQLGGHIKFWSRPSLQAFLEKQGFTVLECIGVGRVRWLWKSMILVATKGPAVKP
jgi:SAM-dependent methyltransferase